MKPDTILILEDNDERIAAFRLAVAALGGELKLRLWHDAPTMLAEAGQWLDQAILISLDHDLNPMPGVTADPGTGLEVAAWIAQQTPRCPVILHSSNAERVQSMVNEMRFGGWTWERVAPWGDEWIGKTWQARARALIDAHRVLRDAKGTASSLGKPSDHAERMNRARLAFDGLSVGDAFGECFFCSEAIFQNRIANRHAPPSPWFVTDDTIMAISVLEMLEQFGYVERLALAKAFAARYTLDPRRGYGSTAHRILQQIRDGASWIDAAARAFDGMGSMGNGGAMRVAPLGAYFAGDLPRLVSEAAASAQVTHAHREGKAGAIAVALAAAWAATHTDQPATSILESVHELTPDGETRRGIAAALRLPAEASVSFAGRVLGNGSKITAPDTVPFCLWVASRHLHDYQEALWATASVGGDIDTNCAIVGGIVALRVGWEGIPASWLAAREAIPSQLLPK